MKLLLLLSHSGALSRRKAFDAIRAGHVIVNGQAQREPSTEVDESRDRVEYSGRLVELRKFEYVMLNKPRGVVTTCEGQFEQRIVLDLLPPELRHLRPVGRLDQDTEGLLLLTNDGELANRLMHPSFDVDKVYRVKARFRLQDKAIERLEKGVVIEGERTAPARVKVLTLDNKESEFEITIHEGRKHQVRLMCKEVGHQAIALRRLQQGPLLLGPLRPGEWRRLTYHEVGALKAIRPARPGASFDSPREESRRLKPVFSSNSPARRFSTTRTWNSDNDVHAPSRPPRFEKPQRDISSGPRREDRRGPPGEDRRSAEPGSRRNDRRGPSRDERRPPSGARREEGRSKRPYGKKPFGTKPSRPARDR